MPQIDPALHPPTIIYGSSKPELRLRQHQGTQTYFCLNNRNLHLTPRDFNQGTFEAGRLLKDLHRELCAPNLQSHEPCPAFVQSYEGSEKEGLKSVKVHPIPQWERCLGTRALLDNTETKDERAFLLAYLDDKWSDESTWRRELVTEWHDSCAQNVNEWEEAGRCGKFEAMMFATLRFPALIPQVWLNWLYAAPDSVICELDRNPSRVDFVAFWRGTRNVIEIDGASHYADWDGSSYKVDERAYARNLKIERSLHAQAWRVIRIGRVEIEDAIGDDDDALGRYLRWTEVLATLPFYEDDGYPKQWTMDSLIPEYFSLSSVSRDDIPF